MRARVFVDRTEAGRLLADKLRTYAACENLLVLGLPRGGIPVAFEIAQSLGAPLDVFVVRKLGVPGQEELAMGAIASGSVRVVNEEVVRQLGISEQVIGRVADMEAEELSRREALYRAGRPALGISGGTVILVDDGLATGSTLRAAIRALRKLEPAAIVVAVPVGPETTCREIRREVDDLVCLSMPDSFESVGRWYQNFPQTSDQEVRRLLDQAALLHPAVEWS